MFFVSEITTVTLVIVAAIYDIKSRRIPNWLTFGGIILGILSHSFSNGWSGLIFSLSGFLLGSAILIVPFILRGMGAGDVKLLAAIGAFVGFHSVVYVAVFGALMGGAMAAITAIRKNMLREALMGIMMRNPSTQIFIPYGAAIAAGTLMEIVRLNGFIW